MVSGRTCARQQAKKSMHAISPQGCRTEGRAKRRADRKRGAGARFQLGNIRHAREFPRRLPISCGGSHRATPNCSQSTYPARKQDIRFSMRYTRARLPGRTAVRVHALENRRPPLTELAGQYRMISTIRIDPARTGNHHIFRIKNWTIALLVSNTLKDALSRVPELGVLFAPVLTNARRGGEVGPSRNNHVESESGSCPLR